MQAEIFVEWMKHFVDSVKPTKELPVLLLLDGHSSHTENIAAIDIARENGIVMLCFPPHSTHKTQPLDVAFMGPFGNYYSREVKVWLWNNPITQLQIGKVFGLACAQTATLKTAVSAFNKTGMYPTNHSAFGEEDFIASETTKCLHLRNSSARNFT
jgi:hypothetical protein